MTQILSRRVRASLRVFNGDQTADPPRRPYHPSAMLPLVSREMYEADRKRAASSKQGTPLFHVEPASSATNPLARRTSEQVEPTTVGLPFRRPT